MAGKKFLIVGSGGREGAFAARLATDTELYAIVSHENPTIVECVKKTGGKYVVDDPNDPASVLRFATDCGIDYVFVSADDPLANGVIDALLEKGFKAIGGTRNATRIEWDKIYSIEMMKNLCPEFTPFYRIAGNVQDLAGILDEFRANGMHAVVKPQGLTGGKGVKVMPEHLPTYNDCMAYATSLFADRPGERVLIVEKLDGIEFTIMGITDGKNLVLSPASYDYPFRYEGDRGPGTGGMGCFTAREKMLPFMTGKDLEDCRGIMQKVIDGLASQGMPFKGVLNGGFFKTKDGIRFMEFNGRFGDPEALNILCVLEGSFSELLIRIWNGGLAESDISFAPVSSVVKYLVAKEYPSASRDALSFEVDEAAMGESGVQTFFASCIMTGSQQYRTLKKSRAVAFAATAKEIHEASDMVNAAIEAHVRGPLEYRADIGSAQDLEKLQNASDRF